MRGIDRAGNDAADAGDEGLPIAEADDAGGGADDVDYVAEADVGAERVPVGVECAGGDGDSGGEAEGFGPLCGEMAGDLVGGCVAPGCDFVADAGEQRVDGGEELLRRQAPPARVPHPFVAHGADAARDLVGIGDAAEGGGDHVAVLQRGDETGAQLGVVAQPVEELGPAPLGAVDAAAPGDALEVCGVRGAGDLGGFAGGAVIAPEVILAEGHEAFADDDDAGAGGVERDGFNLMAVDAADAHGLAHGAGEGGHLVVVRLGFELRVGGRAAQRVLCYGGAELAAELVEDGDTHAQRAEVDACHYAHGCFSLVFFG